MSDRPPFVPDNGGRRQRFPKRLETASENRLEVPMNMNMNPWIIQALVDYEKDRIQRDMKQIRLEEEALQLRRAEENITKTRLSPPRLLMRIATLLVQSMFGVGK